MNLRLRPSSPRGEEADATSLGHESYLADGRTLPTIILCGFMGAYG